MPEPSSRPDYFLIYFKILKLDETMAEHILFLNHSLMGEGAKTKECFKSSDQGTVF